MLLNFILATCYVMISSTAALKVTSMKDCPALTPRSAPARDVTDLRVDDIKVMASLGERYVLIFVKKKRGRRGRIDFIHQHAMYFKSDGRLWHV